MNIDFDELDKLYDDDQYKTIITKLTAINLEKLPFEAKIYLALAYNGDAQYDNAIVAIEHEAEKGRNNISWNTVLCYAYYQKGNFNRAYYHPDDIDLLKEKVEFYEIAQKYNEQGLALNNEHEWLYFLKPHIKNYLEGAQKILKKSLKPKPKKVKITEEEYNAKYDKIFDDYFNAISSDTLKIHRTIASWNWDNPYKHLFLIAQNKNTDIGTALMLFWQGQPLDYWIPYTSVTEVKNHHKESFELAELLFQNIKNNFYTKGNIAYDPKNDDRTNWTEAYNEKESPKKLDAIFFEKTEGKKVKSTYIEGFPTGVWNKIEKLDELFYY